MKPSAQPDEKLDPVPFYCDPVESNATRWRWWSEWPKTARQLFACLMSVVGAAIGIGHPAVLSMILGVLVVWSLLDLHINANNPDVRGWSHRKRALVSTAYVIGFILFVTLIYAWYSDRG